MQIAGIIKNSFVDYPNKIAAAIFTPGCNMNCFYCHNRDLLDPHKVNILYSPEVFLTWLSARTGFLDGVVISGGEPTLQPDLTDFIHKIKRLGFPVKLDTNGTHPQLLHTLIKEKLIDYAAMDIKAPLKRYTEISGMEGAYQSISRSIDCLLEGRIHYEFRTTFVPQLNEDDIISIANRITGAERYVLQQYQPPPGRQEKSSIPPHPDAYFRQVSRKIKGFVQHCEVRGLSS